ncbi:DUF4261 domain-containing protein [Desertivirga arenae]|uniref:DUF4261 domain-containing protein n=1 Tax=Desertivirga arenae TaxID=2810309 RepID=UPI001A956C89|nr:DUF4261 domain-containing protein [Pedobacter sp. SYSU D00823]
MGLFNIFKKKKLNNNDEHNSFLAMLMYNSSETYQLDKLIEQLRVHWQCKVDDINGDEEAGILEVDGQKIMLATIPSQIPWDDIEGTAQYAYNWETAATDLKDHNSHVIVSAFGSASSGQQRAVTLTKVIASILTTSNAVGVYKGAHSLLISNADYQAAAESLKDDTFPVSLWIYLGVRKSGDKTSLYTYGLKEFGKMEMEIIDSPRDIEYLYEFLLNICHYVLTADVTLKDGETLGPSAEEKIEISLSEGKFVEGQSLKLGF